MSKQKYLWNNVKYCDQVLPYILNEFSILISHEDLEIETKCLHYLHGSLREIYFHDSAKN